MWFLLLRPRAWAATGAGLALGLLAAVSPARADQEGTPEPPLPVTPLPDTPLQEPEASVEAAPVPAPSPPVTSAIGVSGNPINSLHFMGTGQLGQWLGLPADGALRIGGVAVGTSTPQLSGGSDRGALSWAGFVALELSIDLEKAIGWNGAKLSVAGLQYNVQPVNQRAGSVQGVNSVSAVGPNNRTELYNYLFSQNLFADQFQLIAGKLIPTISFGNATAPDPSAQNENYGVPSLSGLSYTPVFVVPTMLGRIPGYPDSALGVTTTIAPNAFKGRTYISAGVFDGRLGAGQAWTGLVTPSLKGPLFSVLQVGTAWRLGQRQAPGQLFIGGWHQSGPLGSPGGLSETSAGGVYGQVSQRVASFRYGKDSSGLNVFLQVGWSPSVTNLINSSIGGGLTVLAPFASRPKDSYGIGLSWARLNDRTEAGYGFNPSELMLQAYAQFHLVQNLFLQPVITTLPLVGITGGAAPSVSATLQLTALF